MSEADHFSRPVPGRMPYLAAAALMLIALLAARAHASESIRVAVADNQTVVVLRSASGMWREGAGRIPEKKLVFTAGSVGTRPVRIKTRADFIQTNGRSYRGTIEVRKRRNGLLLLINELDIEDYLKGVVAAEIPHDWHSEALKAQAVASRSYALYRKHTAGSRPYDLLSGVDGQVYEGKSGEHPSGVKAARDTEGIVLTYAGKIIPAFYHASCGGHTENAFELWGFEAPYLQGVDCECQRISKYGVWEKRITSEQLLASLRKLGYRLGSIRDIQIDGITPAGRVKQLAIRDDNKTILVPAERLRAAVGYSAIPSVFFEIELSGSEIVISGRGMGHGVGLCQWGAEEMAQRGYDYRAILSHYYPGTHLIKEIE